MPLQLSVPHQLAICCMLSEVETQRLQELGLTKHKRKTLTVMQFVKFCK
ncbi:hypothetical protein GXM_00411 [Nostoc sphaeroides CCNUC1]|uniref:Uncharacterized protein n=1 Tax=Nostoc sphaeroides CCNUC1 TaxID=2653204 RepID=A0A5P8VR52_9NOSO|nr:hypothetical protein GXM_00411 [Nostoc sphaeroides CCNUC1]